VQKSVPGWEMGIVLRSWRSVSGHPLGRGDCAAGRTLAAGGHDRGGKVGSWGVGSCEPMDGYVFHQAEINQTSLYRAWHAGGPLACQWYWALASG
jgi:hypothetical protein